LYVRIWCKLDNVWQYNDYTYFAAGNPDKAMMVSPTPGTTLHGSSVTFQWSAGRCAQYWLSIGNTVGGTDIADYNRGTSLDVGARVPIDGRTIYVRLWCRLDNVWQFIDYTYITGP
jgi:hypothetical protein